MVCGNILCRLRLQALKEKDLGNAAYKQRNFDEAIKHYDKAIDIDSTNIIFYNNKAGMICYPNFKINLSSFLFDSDV